MSSGMNCFRRGLEGSMLTFDRLRWYLVGNGGSCARASSSASLSFGIGIRLIENEDPRDELEKLLPAVDDLSRV